MGLAGRAKGVTSDVGPVAFVTHDDIPFLQPSTTHLRSDPIPAMMMDPIKDGKAPVSAETV